MHLYHLLLMRRPPLLSSFRWVKDDEVFRLERNGSGTLIPKADEALEDYEGTYRCYASNPLGTAMTQPVKVISERESTQGTK